MESITARGRFLATLGQGPGEADRLSAGLGLGVLGFLAVLDALLTSTSLTGLYTMAPFVSAMAGGLWGTTLVSAFSVYVSGMSPFWNDGSVDDAGYLIRLVAVAGAGALAMFAAWVRVRSRVDARRLERLDGVNQIADGSLDLAETLRRVTELIVPEMADMCMIDAVRDGAITRAAVRAHGHPDVGAIEARIRGRQSSVPSWLVGGEQGTERRSLLVPAVDDEELAKLAHDPDDRAFLHALRLRSYLIVPLVARRRTLGALTMVVAWSGRHYDEDDLRFAQILAGRVALALDNAGLFSDLESIERRMDAVMSLLSEAVTVHDAAGRLAYANAAAARWFDFSDPEGLLGLASAELLGRLALYDERGERVDADEFVTSRLGAGASTRELLRMVDPATGEERWAMVSSEPIRGPDGQALYAVTTIEDVTQLKRSEFAQQVLADIGQLLTVSRISLAETLAELARVAVPRFSAWCAVSLRDPKGEIEEVAVAEAGPGRGRFAERMRDAHDLRPVQGGALAELMETGAPLLLRREAEPGSDGSTGDGTAAGSAIAVPVIAGRKVLGALTFVNDSRSRGFDETDLVIAIEIGRRIGIALEDARLAGERAETARVLQAGLLPASIPEMQGWEVATMYRPAGGENEVGGDFYEAFEVEGGWVVALGDVAGKGAAAASLTALVRHTIRTAARLTGDPEAAARQVHDSLRQQTDLALCSALILVLPESTTDPARVRVLSAGHPLPLLLRGSTAVEVGTHGPLLGAADAPRWSVETVELREGDQLVMYTDGVTEARGERDRFGDYRLRAKLASVPDPASAVARVEAALDAFLVNEPEDDAAMLAMKRTSVAPEPAADPAAAVRAGGR
jgi:PAS domain S-box-containing protein